MPKIHPDRYERQRAAWIARRASIWDSQRRRADLLKERARARDRARSGTGTDAYDENVTDRAWARTWQRSRNNDGGHEFGIWLVLWGFVALAVGPGLYAGRYLVLDQMEQRVPEKTGRVPLWHLAAVSAAFLAVFGAAAWFVPDLPFWGRWALVQVAVTPAAGLAFALLWGWAACMGNVPAPTPQKSARRSPQAEEQSLFGTLPFGTESPKKSAAPKELPPSEPVVDLFPQVPPPAQEPTPALEEFNGDDLDGMDLWAEFEQSDRKDQQ